MGQGKKVEGCREKGMTHDEYMEIIEGTDLNGEGRLTIEGIQERVRAIEGHKPHKCALCLGDSLVRDGASPDEAAEMMQLGITGWGALWDEDAGTPPPAPG